MWAGFSRALSVRNQTPSSRSVGRRQPTEGSVQPAPTSGCSAAWQRAPFGTARSQVQILPPRQTHGYRVPMTTRGKLADRPWRALRLAAGFAAARNHVLVTPTVALAGIAGEGECRAARILAASGVTAEALLGETHSLPVRSEPGLPCWGPSLCAAVDAADEISEAAGVPYTDAEHLTLALLQPNFQSSHAAVRLGLDLDSVRSKLAG